MTTNKLLRHITAARSLRLLARGQASSRADIARELGLTRATVGYAIAELTDAGLIVESSEATTEGRKGRPSIGIKLNPKGAYFVGVDIGTKVLTTVVLNLAMTVMARRIEPAGPDYRDADKIAARLLPAAQAVLGEAGISRDMVDGIGISVPGLIGRDGRVVNAPFLEWNNYPLHKEISRSCPDDWSVVVCNDAFAFATAERAVLTDAGSEDLFLMLLAEGIGGATIDDGRIFSGAHGFAGEVGHTLIAVEGRSEPLENLAGAKFFSDFLEPNQSVADGVASLLARQYDADVSRKLDAWANALAAGLANVIHLLDPGRILLGGPIAALYPTRASQIGRALQDLLLTGFAVPVITVASFGADGAAIGAAATVREQMFTLPELDG